MQIHPKKVTVREWPSMQAQHMWPPRPQTRSSNPWSRKSKELPRAQPAQGATSQVPLEATTRSSPSAGQPPASGAVAAAEPSPPQQAESDSGESSWDVDDETEALPQSQHVDDLDPLLLAYLDVLEAKPPSLAEGMAGKAGQQQARKPDLQQPSEPAEVSEARNPTDSGAQSSTAQGSAASGPPDLAERAAMPPPPPPVHHDEAGKVARAKQPALASVVLTGKGKVSFHESKRSFEAVCERHLNCTMTRAAYHSPRVSGRPLGLLSSWLLLDATPDQHKDRKYLQGVLDLGSQDIGQEPLAILARIGWASCVRASEVLGRRA